MNTDRELLQQALEALENTTPMGFNMESDKRFYAAITALRERLAQPEQKPVTWRDHVEQSLLNWRQRFVNKSGDQLALDDFMDKESLDDLLDYVLDEYAYPQPRQWVDLTDADIHNADPNPHNRFDTERLEFGRRLEALMREKNT